MTEQQIRERFYDGSVLSEGEEQQILDSLVELGAEKAWPIIKDLSAHVEFSKVIGCLKSTKYNKFSIAIMVEMGYAPTAVSEAIKRVEEINANAENEQDDKEV